MKVIIDEDTQRQQTEIVIHCTNVDAKILEIMALISTFDQKLTGRRDGEIFVVDAPEVLYFDSVDKRTFIYTKDEILETPLRLYELDERFSGGSFFRASKATIINIAHIASFRPELSGRFEVTMDSGERLYVSRQYVPMLKQKLKL